MAEEPMQRGMTRRKFLTATGGALGVGLLAGTGIGYGLDMASDSSESSGGASGNLAPVRIGSPLPLTGFGAADGLEHQQGIQLAVDQWNERGGAGGRKVELLVEDVGEWAPEKVNSTFRRLIEKEQVDAIILGYNLYGGPEYEIVSAAEIPYLHVNTMSSHLEYFNSDPSKYWMVFMFDCTEQTYGAGLPEVVNELEGTGKWKPKKKELALLYPDTAQAADMVESAREAMDKAGWTTTFYEGFVTPMNEWGAILNKLRGNPPDFIFLADSVLGDAASFTKQFRENPTPSLLYIHYIPSTPEFINLTKQASSGVLWSTVIGALTGPKTDAFRDAFRKKYSKEPGVSASAYTYDMTNAYLSAVSQVGDALQRRAVCETLYNLYHRGVCGTYRFLEDHTAPSYPSMTSDPAGGVPQLYFEILNEQQNLIYPEPYAAAAFELPPWF